ncbi:hypothetical protein B0I35DRAFT_445416 [Stachybotrys elegans]|uniref:Uncharacterized protein n=1 Tax=Stachybotrys elegans TaxID=80388 RepID=A0A8K0WJH0_9HYPO|nr:hypothetical protein B0I35DRAFT_445416 [Stachybotrys elegans]
MGSIAVLVRPCQWNLLPRTQYSGMYVLSLPGFRWPGTKGLSSVARAEHACAVVGRRQILS